MKKKGEASFAVIEEEKETVKCPNEHEAEKVEGHQYLYLCPKCDVQFEYGIGRDS